MTPVLGIIASSNQQGRTGVVGAYEPIAVATVPSGGLTTITFGSIPQTYTHLQIRYIGRVTSASNDVGLYVKFNNSDANYQYNGGHALIGTGSTFTSVNGYNGTSTVGGGIGQLPGANRTSGVFGTGVIDILDYANTNKNTVVRTLFGYDSNGAGQTILLGFVWVDTSAVTSILINPDQPLAQNSQFALYGIKG
jgi:hypothetical protein